VTEIEETTETPEEKKARKAARKLEKDARKAEKKARKAEKKRARQDEAATSDAAAAAAGSDRPGSGALTALLQAAARGARTVLATRLLAHGLYAGQEQVLLVLDEGGPQSLGDLADALGVRAPTITKTVARMETQGFLSRTASADDGRSVIISLTAPGREALRGARESLRETEALVFASLKKSDRKQLAVILGKLSGEE
jgi:DNA-binding MarR family transcriptional regulator